MWKVTVTQKPDQCLGEWIDREALAEAMIPLIGQLYRNNNVVSSIYGRSLINQSVIAILKAHRFARHRSSDDSELSVHETFPLLKAMSEPARRGFGRSGQVGVQIPQRRQWPQRRAIRS